MDLNQTNEPRFTDEEMAEVDRLQSDPTSEYYYNDPDESFMDRLKRKLEPYGEDFKGFVEYLFTPSRHFGTGQYNEGGVAEQMEMFGYTAEGAQQEADKFVEEAGDLETDISKAASFIVPFYDSGVNIANVAQEYMKPEQERDYDYIKSQFTEAGQSAAIEGGLLLMGGVAGKYGAKGIKALADKVKQYEIDPTAMSAFGAGAIRNKSDDITKLNQDKVIDEISEVESASNPKPVKISNKQKTVKAYKLFKTNDKGDLYPLFVKMEDNKPIPKGKWIKAEEGSINLKTGKVKSSIGDLAYRPGFHAGDLPIATHIGGKVDLKTGQRLKGSMPPNIREENQVWAEVEMLDEVDWQSVADKRARIKKDGTPDVKTAHITDQIPFGGFYRYKTNPNMTGNWLIGGELKVKKVLSSDEVKKINDKAGVSDLPKLSDLGLKFNKGGAVMDDQMEMAFMQEGGIADDGMDVDPVSGNEVPPGSLAEEVRDDIPAQLSEGEYIVPADVVRYYGVKFFEDLRDQAKMGLADMEANGRIGGEPVPEGGPKNENLTPEEQQAVEAMMGMQQGGAVQNPYLQQQQLYNQEPPKAVGNTMGYATGGSPAPVNQLQTQAITPTVYNQPNYSFLSPSTTTQTSQTTEQAINQATQNVFSPVMMRSPEGVEAEAKTRAQMKQWLAAGWVIITAADTPITTDLTGAKVTTGSGPKGSVSDVGGGGSGGTTPTPEKIDYTTYRPDELLEAFDKNRKTRIALTALGAVNPLIALFGQGATRAQEKEILAAMEAQGIKPPEDEGGIVDNITDFVSGLFGKDKEEVKTNVVQQSEPEPSAPIKVENTFNTPTKKAAKKALKGSSRATNIQVGKAAARGASQKEQQKIRDEGAKVQAQLKDMASGKNTTGRTGFKEGGLMNKKGNK